MQDQDQELEAALKASLAQDTDEELKAGLLIFIYYNKTLMIWCKQHLLSLLQPKLLLFLWRHVERYTINEGP